MEIQFTDATIEDADALLSLVHQLEHFISKETLLNNLAANFQNKEYCLFVARESNRVIAFAELHFTQFIHESKPRVRLTSFCVDTNYRNKNIGTDFLEFIEHFCKEHHFFRLELTSNVRRLDAHRFYEKNGYMFTSKRFFKEF